MSGMNRSRRVLVVVFAVVIAGRAAPAAAAEPTVGSAAAKRAGPFRTPPGMGPVGSQRAPDFRLSIAIYHLPRPRQDPAAVLAKLRRTDTGLTLVDHLPRSAPARPQVALFRAPLNEFPPPDDDTLEHFGRGLTAADRRALASTGAVSALMISGPGAEAVATNRRAEKLVADLVRASGGLIWDPEARLMYSLAAWEAVQASWTADGIPDVRRHIAIHAYRDGELIRMITLGMSKFALPDLVVNQVASGHSSMEMVINLLCQRLIEGGAPAAAGRFELALDDVRHPEVKKAAQPQPNASRRATLRLQEGKREEGDAENRLLEIAFPGPSKQLQEQHDALLTRLFGREAKVIATKHDEALEAASARAKRAMLKLKPRYRMQPPLGEQLMVKAPFETDEGGTEWMWVEVVRWDGRMIDGVLQNDPQNVAGLKAGARVRVDEATLFDYLLTKADGSREGNETGALLEKRR
jgi:uncharacterized protein YegJ (DUF2314 family)